MLNEETVITLITGVLALLLFLERTRGLVGIKQLNISLDPRNMSQVHLIQVSI